MEVQEPEIVDPSALEALPEPVTEETIREKAVAKKAQHEEKEEIAREEANISKQIENELEYPGQIKVSVVRESRCVEYAK